MFDLLNINIQVNTKLNCKYWNLMHTPNKKSHLFAQALFTFPLLGSCSPLEPEGHCSTVRRTTSPCSSSWCPPSDWSQRPQLAPQPSLAAKRAFCPETCVCILGSSTSGGPCCTWLSQHWPRMLPARLPFRRWSPNGCQEDLWVQFPLVADGPEIAIVGNHLQSSPNQIPINILQYPCSYLVHWNLFAKQVQWVTEEEAVVRYAMAL